MFTGIWAKIVAGMSAVIGVMLIRLKLKNDKIENLERENAAHVKRDEIDSTIEKAQAKAEKVEQDARQDFDDSDWKNKI